jgi:hypothetical protein
MFSGRDGKLGREENSDTGSASSYSSKYGDESKVGTGDVSEIGDPLEEVLDRRSVFNTLKGAILLFNASPDGNDPSRDFVIVVGEVPDPVLMDFETTITRVGVNFSINVSRLDGAEIDDVLVQRVISQLGSQLRNRRINHELSQIFSSDKMVKP